MKRGNTAAAGNYIGPLGELLVDTGLQTVRVQDGVTAGGMSTLATNVQIQTLSAAIANISANTSGLYSNANVASYLTASNIITGINANVTAANLQITNLWSNAGVQADAIAGANAAIITANTALKGYVDTQLSTLTNGASTALDTLLEIGTALGNNANFSATMVTWLGNVTANITAANTAIDTLQANLGGYYNWANANVTGLYGIITAANTAWQSNAGIQADAIVSLTANAGVQADAITSLQANITAANLAIAAASGTYSNTNVAAYLSASTTSNVGAGNLTVVNNFSTNVISANSFTYANGASILAGIGGTYTNSNVAAYLPTYTGNIAGNIVKNGYTWTFGTDGTTTFPAGGTVTEGGGLTGAIRLTPAGGANANQALLIYPTAAGDGDHIHLTAGGGSTELYLGNDLHYVKLVDGGNVEIRATTANLSAQAAWTFDTTGNIDTIQALGIKVPNGVPSSIGTTSNDSQFWDANYGSNLATTGGSGTGLTVNVSDGGSGYASVSINTPGTGYTNGDSITVTNGPFNGAPIASSVTFTIFIGGRNTWQFGTNGNLTLPETGYLKVGSGIVAGFASSPAPVISGFSSISAENFRFQGNGVNILSTVTGTYSNTNVEAYIGANIGTLYSNAATQATSINAITANIGSFYTYANLNYGTSSYANANVIANLQNFVTSISTSANITTTANVIAPRYLFANGVNILSTITAVANLSNLTGNISWTAVGATPPTFTTASNGTKIVLWPSISSTMVDYAIGIEGGNTWFSIPQAANNFGYKWYAGNTAIATLLGNGTLTTGNITTTGNVSATNFVGNGAGLTNVTVSAAGNIVGTSSNVTLVAGNYSYTFDNTGNVTLPANVFVGVTNTFLPNTVASFSANVNYYSQVTLQNKNSGNDATADYIVTANNGSDTVNFLDLGIINSGYDNTTPSNSLGNIVFAADSYIYAQGNTSNANQSGGNLAIGTTTTGKTIKFFTGGTTSSAIAMTVANTGVTVGGNITATGTLSGSGSGLTGVALKTTGSWTVTTGTNTYSFTVPASGTYQLWVDCNIPNGILVWNATATVSNTNVPVVGAQYAWVYNGGGSPIDFVSIPDQFTGTGNTIVRSNVAPSATTNRFDFGLNNTSGGNVTVRYGWVAIS